MAEANNKTYILQKASTACPICFETFNGDIRLCATGHSFCNSCTAKLYCKLCPMCNKNFTNQKNYQLEELVQKFTTVSILSTDEANATFNVKCPSCSKFLASNIFLCEDGHSVCMKCFKKNILCPTCHKHFVAQRNFHLEQLINDLNDER